MLLRHIIISTLRCTFIRSTHLARRTAPLVTPTPPQRHFSHRRHRTAAAGPSHVDRMNNPYASLVLQPPVEGVLPHAVDRYNGVTVPDTSLTPLTSAADFERALASSMANWIANKRRGLWIQIPVEKAAFITVAAEAGFECHHAQPKYVMMTLWLPEKVHADRLKSAPADAQAPALPAADAQVAAAATAAASNSTSTSTSASARRGVASPEPSMIPAYATHSLGIGCVVFNSRGQLLVIQECFAHPLLPDFWKLPGGAVDAGEDLPQAAEREVMEETSVRATFRSLIGFRHLTNYRFGTGDLYFIAVCTAAEEDGIHDPTPQPEEISAAKWMDLQDFLHFHSSRWMQELVREPLLQEWSKLYPTRQLPPPPSPERIAELQSMPPHPKADEGKSYPVVVPPLPPTPGASVGMPFVRFKGLLGSAESNFYVATPPSMAHLRGEAAQVAAQAAAQSSNSTKKQ